MVRFNICLSCDNNYVKYAGVVIASILLNSEKDESFVFYILEQNISEDNKKKLLELKKIKDCEINIITPSEELFESCKNLRTISHITLPAYFRLKIGSLIDAKDRVLYLDCDLIVNKSLKEVYFTDFQDNFCAGVRDISKKIINSGVLLINLDKWRKDNAEKLIFDYIKRNKNIITTGDQEIINNVFKDKILELPAMWNVQVLNFYSFSTYEPNQAIIHYIGGSKPWMFGSFMPFKKNFFYYLSKTPWKTPSPTWQIISNVYSYLRYFKRKPLFFTKPEFLKAFKNGIIRYIKSFKKTNSKKKQK